MWVLFWCGATQTYGFVFGISNLDNLLNKDEPGTSTQFPPQLAMLHFSDFHFPHILATFRAL